MPSKNKTPPLLKGFTTSGAGKGTVISNPTTSLWLAIIFVGILAGLMSLQRNLNNANDSLLNKDKNLKRSGFIIDAPEKAVMLVPPPNPELARAVEEELPIVFEDPIELKNDPRKIQLRPMDVGLEAKLPENYLKADPAYSAEPPSF